MWRVKKNFISLTERVFAGRIVFPQPALFILGCYVLLLSFATFAVNFLSEFL
jgi:hypothetical protein